MEAGGKKSLTWQAEIELSSAADEQAVSDLLFSLPHVLYVQKLTPCDNK